MPSIDQNEYKDVNFVAMELTMKFIFCFIAANWNIYNKNLDIKDLDHSVRVYDSIFNSQNI